MLAISSPSLILCRHNGCSSATIRSMTASKPKPTHNKLGRLKDPSREATWTHRAWFASGCSALVFSLSRSIIGSANSHIWLEPILGALIGYIVADLGTGVYHWVIDNYGSDSTPIFGSQIVGFQGHHDTPMLITKTPIETNLHPLAQGVTLILLPVALTCDGPVLHGFLSTFLGCIMFSQQFHSWAHNAKSRLPPLVVAMQDYGVVLPRSQHAKHHRPPYNSNYCIVSGVWNKFLDEYKVFKALEIALFLMLGVKPRSWCEPGFELKDNDV